MRRLTASLAVAALTMVAVISTATGQSQVKSGVLECRGGASIGLVVGSSSMMTCVYRGEDRFEDRYVAIVRKIGLDLGVTKDVSMAWGVFNPTGRIGPGDLVGNYSGVSGSASVGVGLGANALLGGSNNTIALQPLSVQGQTGLNIQVGLEGIELRRGDR
jgi:hypothetical protein